jgi:hypothetical protein
MISANTITPSAMPVMRFGKTLRASSSDTGRFSNQQNESLINEQNRNDENERGQARDRKEIFDIRISRRESGANLDDCNSRHNDDGAGQNSHDRETTNSAPKSGLTRNALPLKHGFWHFLRLPDRSLGGQQCRSGSDQAYKC